MNTLNRRVLLAFFISLFMAFIIVSCPGESPGSDPAPGIKTGKTVIAVYASGNTLESDYHLVSKDFRQMIRGLSNTSPEDLDLIVAYGGAAIPGWQGMTIAERSDLEEDLRDGICGNENEFRISLPEANMGDPMTLAFFLCHIRDYYAYDRIFLVLIGHGEGYTGMLFDQNHQEDGLMISELKSAFGICGYNVELIGFDSCLMSGLEVADAVSGYARYMIASEESVPAEGWDYDEWISFLAKKPDAPIEEHGAALIESYMKNPEGGKTLALLDLHETGKITQSLDKMGVSLSHYIDTPNGSSEVMQTVNDTQHLGLSAIGTLDPATMDLYSFAENVRRDIPLLSDEANELVDAVNRSVIFSRHDTLVPGAYGVSILSPLQISRDFYEYYRDEASITPGWDLFIEKILSRMVSN